MDSPYLHLADSIRDVDEAQDVRLELLQSQPCSHEDATSILVRFRDKRRNDARRQPMQFFGTTSGETLDPVLDDSPPVLHGIHDAISRLPDQDRELVSLRYIEGLSVTEIAVRLNRDYKTTHTQAATALQKLILLLSKKTP